MSRKTYEKPAIVHTETITTRATVCSKADDQNCMGGPLSS